MRGSRWRPEPGLSGWRARSRRNGYPHELWTTRLLAAHARDHGPRAGHPSLAKLAQGTVCKILAAHEVKPHKVRYYLERRDPEFEPKMAEVLCAALALVPIVRPLRGLGAANEPAHAAAALADADVVLTGVWAKRISGGAEVAFIASAACRNGRHRCLVAAGGHDSLQRLWP